MAATPIFQPIPTNGLKNDSEKASMYSGWLLEDINTMNNLKTIKKHEEEFSKIWEASDGRYKTYLPANNKRGRKLIASTKKEQVEFQIIEYYKQLHNADNNFSTLYLEWLNMKRLEVSGATIERVHNSYLSYYESKSIVNKSVKDFTYLYLKDFVLTTVNAFHMNYKQYCNFTCVLRGVLEYSIDKGVIESNPFSKFHIGKNTLRSPDNKSSKTEVFSIEERKQFEKVIWNDYRLNPTSAIPLAILLDFYTGLRSGELVSLTWSDVSERQIHVHRTESSYMEINPDGTKNKTVYEVKESPKSDAGFRDVELIPKALEVLEEVKRFNDSKGWDNEFIFLDNNTRIIQKRLDAQIRRYCTRLGLKVRSMHKIRKTYISSLKLANVPDTEIKRLAGHKDLMTTYNSYCFTVQESDKTRNQIISAL